MSERQVMTRDEFIEDVKNTYFDGKIDLTHSRGFCIGDNLNDGCMIDEANRTKNEVTAIIDFNRTSTNMCSLVISPNRHDWRHYVQTDRCLAFLIRVTGDINEFTLEFNIPSSMELRLQKRFTSPFNDIKLRLSDFNLPYAKWSDVREINFLVASRGDINTGTLTVKDKKIVYNIFCCC